MTLTFDKVPCTRVPRTHTDVERSRHARQAEVHSLRGVDGTAIGGTTHFERPENSAG